jgi:hypothetical protein
MKFGRRIEFDDRSRDYRVRKLIYGLQPITNIWPCEKVLDQGNEGSCVGHGIAHELIAEPIPCLEVDHPYAVYIYKEAQKVDEWPGEDYEGTSVLAGLKVVNSLKWCDEYRWSFSHLDTQLGIGYEGPGVAGTYWYTDMMDADSNGFIHVTGNIEGGHCYLLIGVNIEEQYFTILNSWGVWGINGTGRAKLSFDDYEKLRTNEGEMAFLIGRHDINIEPPSPEPPVSPSEPPEPEPSCKVAKVFADTLNLFSYLSGSRVRLIQTRR